MFSLGVTVCFNDADRPGLQTTLLLNLRNYLYLLRSLLSPCFTKAFGLMKYIKYIVDFEISSLVNYYYNKDYILIHFLFQMMYL